MTPQNIAHPIPPVYDRESRVLILGSFPSVKSREQKFFYGHPQNRFWKVVAAVTHKPVPQSIEEKKVLLLSSHIAVWDVIASCDIVGSSDASISNVVANDLTEILKDSQVRKIYCNGSKSYELYCKYIEPTLGIKAEKLPSTSPANAAWSLERLVGEWRQIMLEIRNETE